MDEVSSEVKRPQSEASQDSPQPALQQQTVETTPQQPLEPTKAIKFRQWKIPIIIAVVLFVLSITGFFVYQNYQLKKNQKVNQPKPQVIETKPSPAQAESANEIKIIDGNVCLVTTSNEVKVLVNKNDYQSESISGFDKVITSPDGTKMCFLGYSPVPIWLYSANIDGSGVVKVGLGKNCVWSHNSQKIAFNNYTTDVSPVNILVYDTLLGKTDNITESLQAQNKADAIRFYETPAWSEDDAKVSGEFVTTDMSAQAQRNGISIINIVTGEVKDTITSE
jgi:hypothetical protein